MRKVENHGLTYSPIYHYAVYEITALRRLMSKFGSREQPVDDLLRHDVFVDLYQVVKHGAPCRGRAVTQTPQEVL